MLLKAAEAKCAEGVARHAFAREVSPYLAMHEPDRSQMASSHRILPNPHRLANEQTQSQEGESTHYSGGASGGGGASSGF